MRIKISLTPNQKVVPFNYQHALTGIFHRWFGSNELHDKTSLYSLGWLRNGKASVDNSGLNFPNGAFWELSFFDPQVATNLITRINNDRNFGFGMWVNNIEVMLTPLFTSTYCFGYNSPILVRRERRDGTKDHISFQSPEADEFLTKTFRHKLQLAGFDGIHLESFMGFDRGYKKARTKVVTIKETQLKANECPIIVSGTPETVQFAWNVGAGHLTGSCFGQLKTS